MRATGQANSGRELADLSQYFLVQLDGTNPVLALRRLRANEAVEEAYFQTLPPPTPGDYFPTTPLWEDCAVSTP